jgi:ubiquinone biosynthesis protein
VRIEMDLRMEAAAAEELGANFKDDPGYRTPAVDWDRTAQRVMTMERVRGIPIGDRTKLVAAGHDLNAVLRKSAEAFFYQVFRDGFFHGDVHGGNAFVEESGCVVPVDFGIMGRVDTATRGYMAELLIAFLRRDYQAVAEVQFRAGYVPPDKSVDVFAQACRSIGEPIFGKPSNQISIARLLAQLLRVTEQFEMEVQPQLLLLQKTMLMAEGMGTRLNPDVNIWELARPLIEDWMRRHFGPRARVERAVGETLDAIRRLPRLVDTVEQITERERRRAQRELATPPPDVGGVRRTRADWALLLAVGALAAAIVSWWR